MLFEKLGGPSQDDAEWHIGAARVDQPLSGLKWGLKVPGGNSPTGGATPCERLTDTLCEGGTGLGYPATERALYIQHNTMTISSSESSAGGQPPYDALLPSSGPAINSATQQRLEEHVTLHSASLHSGKHEIQALHDMHVHEPVRTGEIPSRKKQFWKRREARFL